MFVKCNRTYDGLVGQVTLLSSSCSSLVILGVELAGKSLNACLYVIHSFLFESVIGLSGKTFTSDSSNSLFLLFLSNQGPIASNAHLTSAYTELGSFKYLVIVGLTVIVLI